MNNLLLRYIVFSSPLGWMVMAASPEGVCLLLFLGPDPPSEARVLESIRNEHPHSAVEPDEGPSLLYDARDAVLRYLNDGIPLPPFPLDLRSGTPFMQKVWEALLQIPFGRTRSYGEIARIVDRPLAPRAVGQACGRNPIAIFVPCHRVISTNGKLGGYAGGLHIKKALLDLEQGK